MTNATGDKTLWQIRTAADQKREPLLLPCCRLVRGRLLLVLITNLVKPDIHDISVEVRPRRHREAQSFLDIDELDMGLAWRNGYRNPFEFGYDSLGLRTLAHHCIAQGDLDLPRTAHRSEYDAALNADLRPETLVRWHQAGFRRYWRWKSRSLGGRPQVDADLRALDPTDER